MTGIPKKPSGVVESFSMSSATMWRARLDAIAGERQSSDNRESMLARAARDAGIEYRKAKALWYGETIDPKYSVGAKVIRAANRQADRFEAIAASLEQSDPEFHRATIDRYRALAIGVRGETNEKR